MKILRLVFAYKHSHRVQDEFNVSTDLFETFFQLFLEVILCEKILKRMKQKEVISILLLYEQLYLDPIKMLDTIVLDTMVIKCIPVPFHGNT